ncbi:MAG TPA: hypothetical protein VG474_17125 [Solirubrobacteraceae bacterium]|nr:hypothetical protein [Solirubrobacteraceae bacterium]
MTLSLLDSRASFELAAFFVSWVAVALLVVVVGSLHARVRRLEHAGPDARPAPYSHLLGRNIRDILGAEPGAAAPRVLFFLSSNCSSCARLLEELASPSWTIPSAIVWTDGTPPAQPPRGSPIIASGPKLAAELGIRVKPFALVAGIDGRVVKAAPVANLHSLGELAVNGDSAGRRHPILDHA